MSRSTYIHGTDSSEQERLSLLNRLTNQSFLEFLAPAAAQSILEIGSGLGLLAEQVARAAPGGRVAGVELFSAQLAVARQLRQPNLFFVQGDAHVLPFPDCSFDLAYCRYLLEHLTDPLRALKEARRVLTPGGVLHVQENNIRILELYPDCPRFTAVWRRFARLQEQLGGDAGIGKKLFSLFKAAGFHDITLSMAPEIHAVGGPAFRPWIENVIGNVRSGAQGLQTRQLATAEEIDDAMSELQTFLNRDDASMYFYWNRARGRKTTA